MKSGFIDWTDNNLYLHVFEKKSGQCNLVDTVSVPLEGGLHQDILTSLPATGCDEIFLSVPPDRLALREHTFPFSDKEKIKETLAYELEGVLLGNPADYSIDHTVIESLDHGTRVLAVCIEKEKLQLIIDMFSSANLEPKVVTSLDVRLAGGKSDVLLNESYSDVNARADTAGKEILDPLINLRQEEFSFMGDVLKFLKKLRSTAVLVLVLLLFLAAGSTIKLMALNKDQKFLIDEIQKAYHRIFPQDKKVVDPERQLMGNMNTLMTKKESLGGIPVLDILQTVAVRKKADITLNEFNADGKNIVIKGTAKTFEEVESLKDRLSGVFKSVKVLDSDATADKVISFTVIMQENLK